MGKAIISSGGTSGSYQITLDYGKEARDAKVVKLTAAISTLDTTISGLDAQIAAQTIIENAAKATAQVVENAYIAKTKELQPAFEAAQAAEAALFVAINASYPDEGAREAAIAAAQATVAAANVAYKAIEDALKTLLTAHTTALVALVAEKQKTAKLQIQLTTAQADKNASAKEKTRLQALVLEETKQAWCADLTETATGSVATIEIPGESKLILLAPAAPAPTAGDGALSAREMQSPAQVFWNAAVLPGWQKFKPTYRRGTITAINPIAETANVTLYQNDKSSAKALVIDQTTTLSNVPVQYMTCHTKAFEVGDLCVIKFTGQDWSQPKIIGFVDNPRACLSVLSGVVKDGSIVDIGAGKLGLHSYKPTSNAWSTALNSDPTKAAFHNEIALARAGTQYADVRPTLFSGLMAKAVQVIMGRGVVVAYDYKWANCHGISKDSGGNCWLVHISAAGVLAMALPITAGNADSPNDAIKQATILFGGVPSGVAFPVGSKLTEGITAGTVKVLCNAAGVSDFYGKAGIVSTLGWSFNNTGSEAHNTCWDTDGVNFTSYHYKLALSFGDTPNANLTLVSQGYLTKKQYVIGGFFNVIPLYLYDHATNSAAVIPAREVPHDEPDVDGTAPLIACHINGVLEVLSVEVKAEQTTIGEDTGAPLFYIGILPDDWTAWSSTRRAGRRIIYTSQPDAEFGYDVRDTTVTSFSTDYYSETTVKAYTYISTVRLSTATDGTGHYVLWGRLARDAFTVFETPATLYTFHGGETRYVGDWETENGLEAHYFGPYTSNPSTGETLPGYVWVWTGSPPGSGGNVVAVPSHTDVESVHQVIFHMGAGDLLTLPDTDESLRGLPYVNVSYSVFGSATQQVAITNADYYYATGNLLPSADTEPMSDRYTFIGYT